MIVNRTGNGVQPVYESAEKRCVANLKVVVGIGKNKSPDGKRKARTRNVRMASVFAEEFLCERKMSGFDEAGNPNAHVDGQLKVEIRV